MMHGTLFFFWLLVITCFVFLVIPVSSDWTYGRIMVRSDPSGAAVSLDNQTDSFQTPYQYYGVNAGKHTITVTKRGYIMYTKDDVLVSSGRVINIYAALVKDPGYGSIRVSSVPEGADVYIDGILTGKTPQNNGVYSRDDTLYITGLTDGIHTVLLKLQGYREMNQTVETGTDRPGSVLVKMHLKPMELTPAYITSPAYPADTTPVQNNTNPSGGTLNITSDPSGANILMNGTIQGITPKQLDGLPAGIYTFSLQHHGYRPVTASAEIRPGQTTNRSYILIPYSTTSVSPGQTTVQQTPDHTHIPTQASGSLLSTAGLIPGLLFLGISLHRSRKFL